MLVLMALWACISTTSDDTSTLDCTLGATGALWQQCVHTGEVTGLEFLPDGSGLAHAGDDFTYGIVSSSTGEQMQSWTHPHTADAALHLDVSADGSLLVALNQPQQCPLTPGDTIDWRDPVSGELLKTEDVGCDGAHAISIGQRSTYVSWVALDKHWVQYPPPDTGPATQHAGPRDSTSVWTDDVHVVSFVGHAGGLAAYRGDTAFPMPGVGGAVRGVVLDDASATQLVVAGDMGLLHATISWGGDDVPTVVLDEASLSGAQYNAMSATPDLSRVAVGAPGGTVRVYELPASTLLIELQLGSALHDVAISADGSRVAAGSGDGSIAVWEL